MVFQSNFRNEIFTANVNINKKVLDESGVDSNQFAQNSQRENRQKLVGYSQLSVGEIDIIKGEDVVTGMLMVFEGKQVASAPMLFFEQVFVVDELDAYTVTATYIKEEDPEIVKIIQAAVDSFGLE